MAKTKSYSVGEVSFTEAGYNEFKAKSKEEQVDYIANSLSPKSVTKAEKLLKNVPNGDNISEGVAATGEPGNTTSDAGGNAKNNSKKPASN